MVVSKQTTLFAFESVIKDDVLRWLEYYDGSHAHTYSIDAEALVESLNQMPSGKGSWPRCLEVDHSRSYESQFKKWDAHIWFQSGSIIHKMLISTGEKRMRLR